MEWLRDELSEEVSVFVLLAEFVADPKLESEADRVCSELIDSVALFAVTVTS